MQIDADLENGSVGRHAVEGDAIRFEPGFDEWWHFSIRGAAGGPSGSGTRKLPVNVDGAAVRGDECKGN